MTDPTLAKALSHPLRPRILIALENRTASPSELAGELGVSLGVVSYHVRQLHRLGFLRLVDRVPRRGAVEHYYTTVAGPQISSEAWQATPPVVRQAVLAATLQEIGSQASAAAQSGGFEARQAHFSRSPVTLDSEGWKELVNELDELVNRIERIAAESRDRLGASSGKLGQKATLALMLFGTPPDSAGSSAAERARHRRRVRRVAR